MAFILTWLKLSSSKQLAWYRRSNHQSKDIAHGQKVIAQRCADKVSNDLQRHFKGPLTRAC